ncbi:MAG: 50S ribosomal protein L30 [Fimbriimonadaceae bacterium]|nr:50S ribosomal protein L30 [Fimbriimonadaceae bacterium]
MPMLKITLTKSVISEVPKNRKTVKALGLGKTGRSVIQADNQVIRGMVHQVKHMVRVEEVEDQPKAQKRRDPKTASAAPAKAKAAPKTAAAAEKPAAKTRAKTEESGEKAAPKKRTTKKETAE